ncbi:MAG: DUF5671 domain-containing protein [Patescibacteria group bacterium]|jgi:hypothetical protein
MNNSHQAKYAFYYLLSLVALIFTAIAVGLVAFTIIDRTMVDALQSYGPSDSGLRFAISALLIATPIFYITTNLINRGLNKGELAPNSGLRRWLTYFIILVSSLIILGTLVGVINNFLAGELTGRFILKSLAVLLISGLSFSYYILDLREQSSPSFKLLFLIVSLLVVSSAFISTWFFIESPQEARARRLDGLVERNIRSLESVINTYYSEQGQLPNSLEELIEKQYLSANSLWLTNPETEEALVYQLITEEEYELCATFKTSNLEETPTYYYSDQKRHGQGYVCLPGELWSIKEPVLVK